MIDAHPLHVAFDACSPLAAVATLARPGERAATIAQIEVVGGSSLAVFAAFALLVVATVLSLLVTYRYARGYLRTGTRPLLYLAVGLFLLTAAPTFLRLAFANFGDAPDAYRRLAASTAELLGLLTILYTIHR